MTWTEIDAACHGYEVRMARQRELDRLIVTVLVNANRKPGTPAIKPESVIRLITDPKARKVELMSVDEYEETKKLFASVKEWQTLG